MSTARILWLAVLCLAASIASADGARVRVVKVTDGDSLTVLTGSRKLVRVRLAGIDAPEKHQPFGKAAMAALSDLAAGREVVLFDGKYDRDGYLVARMLHEDIDVSLELVRMGLAWRYPMRGNEQTFEEREAYTVAEDAARDAGRRLWSDFAAKEPWEWRAAQRYVKPVTVDPASMGRRQAPRPRPADEIAQ